MIDSLNFKFVRLLYERLNFLVYEGIDDEGKTILIKTTKTIPSSQTEKLKQEELILRRFNTPKVIKSFGLIENKNQYFLILEKFGLPLNEFIYNKNLNLEDFLNLSIGLAGGLGEIHHEHIIHKDIQPQNILIDPNTLAIKFQNFDLATFLSRETQQLFKLQMIEGTLSYISPEQTGRLNYALDYRTDIYSLGVVLYEILTKKVPFQSDDPHELIHMHIAKKPIPPHEITPDIPLLISDIVMKCLSKNMEERYHSAFGLQNDLMEYQRQFKTAQTITYFPAGKFDVYDHFHVSQKLYGREKELQILLSNFDKICEDQSRLLLVCGYSGIGKSSVVYGLQNFVAQKNGYFISGKYDQFKKNLPYSAIIQAFQGLIQQLLSETEEKIEKTKELILKELGVNAQVIVDVIPEIELIIGKQPPVAQLDFQQTEKRFNFVLTKFIEFFLKPEHPLVLFLDDLQWIDPSSLKFLQSFICDSEHKHLLIIGSYRDNEVGRDHPLSYTLKNIEQAGKTYELVELKPLSLESINQLISDTFNNTLQETRSLADIVYQKTDGNPFFSIQFLKMLYKEGILDFNSKLQQWVANLEAIKNLQVTDNVAELMGQRIQSLPSETQNLLKIGSAIGNIFDLQTLVTVSGYSFNEANAYLWHALEEELILLKHQFNDGNADPSKLDHAFLYTFQHDRIQQAAYRLIPKDNLNVMHVQIGQALLKQTPPNQRKDEIITIVNQLNYGVGLLQSTEEKNDLAALNFEAGEKAKAANAHLGAIQYFKTGIELLGREGWQNKYQLQFNLHESLSISYHLSNQLQEAESTVKILFENVKSSSEKFKLYILKIKFHLEINDLPTVYNAFEDALKLANFDLNLDSNSETIFSDIHATLDRLKSVHLNELKPSPSLDENIRNLSSLFTIMALPTYCCNGSLFLLLASKFINLPLTHGISKENILSFVLFGMALASETMQHYEEGVAFGQFAIDEIGKMHNIYLSLNAEFMFYYTTYRFSNLNDSLEWFKNNASKCYEVGNIMAGAGCYVYISIYILILGKPLDWVLEDIKHSLEEVKRFKHPRSHSLISLCEMVAKTLKGMNKNLYDPRPKELLDLSCSSLAQGEDSIQYYTWRIFILFLHEKYQEALEICHHLSLFTFNLPSHPIWMVYYTYYALTIAALYRTESEQKQSEYKILLQKFQERSEKWAKTCPSQYLHLYLIIKAERAYTLNDTETALNNYELALVAAEKGNFFHEAGIICELSGKFHFEGKREQLARFYWEKAFKFYSLWGANAKIEQFKRKYKNLLPDLVTAFDEKYETTLTKTTQTSTETFEVTSILQAAQALSKEIILDKLIQTLMNIVKVEAGAEKVFFIMPKKGAFYVQAETSIGQEQITITNEVPIQKRAEDLCVSMIYYVARTNEVLLLNDALNEGNFQNDLYVKTKQPKSVLCFPLLHLGKISSILYLENNLTKGAFTPDRMRILELLSSQMAISIENAKFYGELEEIVGERTKEVQDKNEQLSQALENLTKMQKQMIQQEKLASLGLLSSGIAHELKNPLNFVINFSELVSDSVNSLNEKIINEELKISVGELKTELGSISDLIKKVVHHSQRVDGIVKGLLPHAYKGGVKAEKTSLQALIDQAIHLTLQVFRKKEPNFVINIISDYDPNVQPQEIFPGELTRVFINLIDNACFAMNQKLKKDPQYKPELKITLKESATEVEIIFRDNGGGVAQSHLDKIFQPFFTTKEVGEGTGLGLSISYDIITQQHNGKMSVSSDGLTFTEFLILLPKKSG